MKLLNRGFCASSLEVCSELLCLFTRVYFLDGLRSGLNEVLSILKAKTANVSLSSIKKNGQQVTVLFFYRDEIT